MIKAVIIDFDDTLCLTEAATFDLENDALVAMGRPPMSRQVHLRTWGQPLFEAIRERSPGIDVEAFKVTYHPLIDQYISNNKLDSISEANYRALDILLEQGRQLMILTSRTHGELKHLLAPDHLLATRIEAFYYKDNMQFHKPDPRAFDELLAHHDLSADECVYVGDSVSDVLASKQRGLHFIACLESGLRQREDFAAESVDAFIDRFADVVSAIQQMEAA